MENEMTGIVIDARDRGRGSCLLELISEQGLSFVLVNSRVKKLGGQIWSDLCQPLHRVHLWLDRRGDWLYAQEGIVQERYEGIRESYSRICAAQKMRLCIKKLARHGLASAGLYQALVAHLGALSQGFAPSKVLASFLAKALWSEGYIDVNSTMACVHCARSGVDLWNESGEWFCASHKQRGFRWSYLQQQMLQKLLLNKKLSELADPQDLEVSLLLWEWLESL